MAAAAALKWCSRYSPAEELYSRLLALRTKLYCIATFQFFCSPSLSRLRFDIPAYITSPLDTPIAAPPPPVFNYVYLCVQVITSSPLLPSVGQSLFFFSSLFCNIYPFNITIMNSMPRIPHLTNHPSIQSTIDPSCLTTMTTTTASHPIISLNVIHFTFNLHLLAVSIQMQTPLLLWLLLS